MRFGGRKDAPLAGALVGTSRGTGFDSTLATILFSDTAPSAFAISTTSVPERATTVAAFIPSLPNRLPIIFTAFSPPFEALIFFAEQSGL
jgi:hypothetical protein